MSGFPSLIRTSKGLKHIPYPSDFGLDTLVDTIFSDIFPRDRRYKPDDFVPQDSVKKYAANVIKYLETDRESILSRQDVLKYFTDHYFAFIYNGIDSASIPVTRHRGDDNWEHRFEENVERVKGYCDFVHAIEKMPDSDNPELDSFKTYISVLKDERFTKLEEMLADIQLPSIMNITGTFVAGSDKDHDMEDRQITMTVDKSGKEIPLEDSSVYSFRSPREESQVGIPYGQIMEKVVDEVKAKTGKKFRFWKPTIDLEFEIDEASKKVTCKAADRKLLSKATEVDVEFNYNDFTYRGNEETHSFSTAIKRAKYNAFNEQLEEYDEDIDNFADPVTELRYLATLAYYFDGLKRVACTTPEISEVEDNITEIKGMTDPNMLRKMPWGAIVGNDIEAGPERNLYVITGPNKDGKTEFQNALAINQAAAQAGWNVFAKEAVLSPKDNIYTHYIQPGDIRVGSRYKHELSRTKEIFEIATRHSLILMDEPFTGTIPEAGEKQADIVMRMLGKLGATAFIAPHYSLLAETAEELPYAGNLHTVETKDEEGNLVYTYKIEEGSSNMAYGDILPKEMGVDEEGLNKILAERANRGEIKLR